MKRPTTKTIIIIKLIIIIIIIIIKLPKQKSITRIHIQGTQ